MAMREWELRTNLDLRTEIIRLQAEGLSQAQIATHLGYDESTINRWYERLDIPARRPVWMVPEAVV